MTSTVSPGALVVVEEVEAEAEAVVGDSRWVLVTAE